MLRVILETRLMIGFASANGNGRDARQSTAIGTLLSDWVNC
jgi:hypothetical protein